VGNAPIQGVRSPVSHRHAGCFGTLHDLLLLACAASDPGSVPGGDYDVTLSPEPDPPVAGDAALSIEATADGAPVEGAEVTVDVWMEEMGHGLSDPPVVTEEGDGVYRATFVYPMSGVWTVTVTVDDTVVIEDFDVG
jgi:hypothetical protein